MANLLRKRLAIGWGTHKLSQQRFAGEVIAKYDEKLVDSNFRTLEKLCPSEARDGRLLAQARAFKFLRINFA